MKTEILKMLKEDQSAYISGEAMSQKLGVSRTAIWKNIKTLRAEGYQIESISNKGYRYVDKAYDLNKSECELAFESSTFIQRVVFFESTDSTNAQAKILGNQGPVVNTLVIADEQTLGRGRLGRSWDSGKGKGLWMSLLLKPDLQPERAACMTIIAAAAMSKAIDELAGVKTQIKWPNDIILNHRKVSGILTELSAELSHINYLVLGMGVNTGHETFDSSLEDKAISLYQASHEKINRLSLAKAFVTHFEDDYNRFVNEGSLEGVINYNRTHSVTLNKEVAIIKGEETRRVKAIDIDELGNLIILNENNEKEKIYYGEVSVRGINGYAE